MHALGKESTNPNPSLTGDKDYFLLAVTELQSIPYTGQDIMIC